MNKEYKNEDEQERTEKPKEYGGFREIYSSLKRLYTDIARYPNYSLKEKAIALGSPLFGALTPIALIRLSMGKSESLLEEALKIGSSVIVASPLSFIGGIAGMGAGLACSKLCQYERLRREKEDQ